jgi:hypothetical protein
MSSSTRSAESRSIDGRRCFRPGTMAAIDPVTTIEEVGQPLLLAS